MRVCGGVREWERRVREEVERGRERAEASRMLVNGGRKRRKAKTGSGLCSCQSQGT